MLERIKNGQPTRRERNTDALFGVLHIKDRPYLHQRAAQHMFGETESAIIVPAGTIASVWDERSGKAKRTLKIAIVALTITGILAFLVYLFRLDPSLLFPFL